MSRISYKIQNKALTAEHQRLKQMPVQGLWTAIVQTAQVEHDFLAMMRMDREIVRALEYIEHSPNAVLRLAILASSTMEHLVPGIRLAAAHHDMPCHIYLPDYGQALQELHNPSSGLHQFKPDIVLISWTTEQLFGTQPLILDSDEAEQALENALVLLRSLRHEARKNFACSIIQQTLLPLTLSLIGNNEHYLPGSLSRLVERCNMRLRDEALTEKFDILSIDHHIIEDGIAAWHDPSLWHRAKQEISPLAAANYGEQVMRLMAAQRGLSRKCLVLDLDNTLWGGMIGDDGLDGIKLGQGSGTGEAFVAFQRYVRDLSRRGVILAVCSKNDEANALLPFQQHPDMVLRREDIACFVANWDDKVSNLQTIAQQLSIGLNALVFVDDNAFERNHVRHALPIVAVPELPQDPTYYPYCLSAAGYFETIAITTDDTARTQQYRANVVRGTLKNSTANPDDYLRGLDMKLFWAPFDAIGLPRITQLINKTNQFNLTTRRYTAEQVATLVEKSDTITLQLRLKDRFGDNGIIAVIIAMRIDAKTWYIDSWLMSCRVLGRSVEQASLALLVNEVRMRGGSTIIGEYGATEKNSMVAKHYPNLGFTATSSPNKWILSIDDFVPSPTFIETIRMSS